MLSLPEFIWSNYIYLIIGFIVLIQWANILVKGASSIASKFGISPLVIGLTIVAFWTSAPELFVNILSALKWETDLALGNVLGSNVANIWLVLGAAALVYPLQAKDSTTYKEVPYSLVASLVLFFLAFDTFFGVGKNIITRGDSFVLLLLFILFFAYTFAIARVGDCSSALADDVEEMHIWKSTLYVFWWLVWLALWADVLVWSAVSIAEKFWVPESVIGLTIVAFGTSLPELVTSVLASWKKQSDIAIGNIVWSNIFNVLLVLWATGVVSNIVVSPDLLIDILIELFAISLLIVFLLYRKRGLITRFEGGIFLLLYLAYMLYIVTSQIS